MKREQIIKILKVCLVATLIMFISEIIFDIPAVTDWFSNIITSSSGTVVYLIIWIIMFLQVTILNIPAYVILSASVSVGIKTLSFQYILVVLSAYMTGCILAYWVGRWFGKKAVKWCAGSEDDYNKWVDVLNKKGKWWYVATVVFPFFPDDLLCLVAGSVKFNFGFYVIANIFGRTVGLVTMLFALELIGKVGGGFPFMIIVWGVALITELVLYFILKSKEKEEIANQVLVTENGNETNKINSHQKEQSQVKIFQEQDKNEVESQKEQNKNQSSDSEQNKIAKLDTVSNETQNFVIEDAQKQVSNDNKSQVDTKAEKNK